LFRRCPLRRSQCTAAQHDWSKLGLENFLERWLIKTKIFELLQGIRLRGAQNRLALNERLVSRNLLTLENFEYIF
jgi:hypothetical protein